MNATDKLQNAYTDAPPLHSNLLIAVCQLYGWLFFHPSAWRHYITRIDPTLRPNFALAELGWTQWRNPAIRQLMGVGFGLTPLLAVLLAGGLLWGIGRSSAEVIFAMSLGLIVGVVGGVSFGAVISVAGGIVFGLTGGIAFGLLGGITAGFTSEAMSDLSSYVAFGAAGSLTGGVISSVARARSHSLARQVAGILASLPLGLLLLAGGLVLFGLVAYSVILLVLIIVGLSAGTLTSTQLAAGLGISGSASAWFVSGFGTINRLLTLAMAITLSLGLGLSLRARSRLVGLILLLTGQILLLSGVSFALSPELENIFAPLSETTSLTTILGYVLLILATLVVAFGLGFGVALGSLARWRTQKWGRSVLLGTVLGLALGITLVIVMVTPLLTLEMLHNIAGAPEQLIHGPTDRVVMDTLQSLNNPFIRGIVTLFGGLATWSMLYGIGFSTSFIVFYIPAERLAGPKAATVVGLGGGLGLAVLFSYTMAQGQAPGAVFLVRMLQGRAFSWWPWLIPILGLTFAWWRPVLLYLPLTGWNLLLYGLDHRRPLPGPSWLRWHSAFWDEAQRLPLLGLNQHLNLVLHRNLKEGQLAIAYLNDRPQRWAVSRILNNTEPRLRETLLEALQTTPPEAEDTPPTPQQAEHAPSDHPALEHRSPDAASSLSRLRRLIASLVRPAEPVSAPTPETDSAGYTDAPRLHPNLILGGLQLLFWLLFHPSAWRNHVAQIDPDLRPDFPLARLSWSHWRHPAIWKLLTTGYILWPFLGACLIALWMWFMSAPDQNTPDILASVMMGTIVGGLTFGLIIGSAANMIAGMVGGLVFILGTGLTLGIMLAPIETNFNQLLPTVIVMGFAAAIALPTSLTSRVALNIANWIPGYAFTRRTGYSFLRRAVGVLLGILAGLITVGSVVGLPFIVLAFQSFVFALITAVFSLLLVGLIIGVAAWEYSPGSLLGLTLGLVLSTLLIGAVALMTFIGVTILIGLTNTVTVLVSMGVAGILGAIFSALFIVPYVVGERIGGTRSGAVAGSLGSGGVLIVLLIIFVLSSPEGIFISDFSLSFPVSFEDIPAAQLGLVFGFGALSVLFGLTLTWWQPLCLYHLSLAWNILVIYPLDRRRPKEFPGLLRWHSAFWDEWQYLRLHGLDEHLLLIAERNPEEGQAAVEYLTGGRQRWAAQEAQIELDARQLERCATVEAIAHAHRQLGAGELAGPVSSLLRSFSRLSHDTQAALQQEKAHTRRLALSAIEGRLKELEQELGRSKNRYEARFRPIASRWHRIISQHLLDLAKAIELSQEIDSPYVIGVPLTEKQAVFVGRTRIIARMTQLIQDRSHPPLLLYGQRRMGKTSLLNNLHRLLPRTIVPMFVDLQGPASRASEYAGFLYNIARGMIDSARQYRGLTLPPLPYQELTDDPFTRFDEWLDEVENHLGARTALLALDEFEALDRAISKGRFDQDDVLGLLRHLIQHRHRFKVLLAGSHTLAELKRWSSYLINVQVIHINYLDEAEVHQLIEQPVAGFALSYTSEASQHIVALTRGHPFLVQLLCAEIVALKNKQAPARRRQATPADVEAAIPEALRHGSFFFADIERNQIDAPGLALLRQMAAHGPEQVVPQAALARPDDDPSRLEQTLATLTRRELIEPVGDGYRFQVELIRRWFAQPENERRG